MQTIEQVWMLAPDKDSASAAKKLMQLKTWPLLAYGAQSLWGHCQGSGKEPYKTGIDLEGPVFKCSCPSRKFPCKHGLALYALFIQQESAFSENTPPDWLASWLEGRQKRKQKAEEPIPSIKDEKAKEKRSLERDKKVSEGLVHLDSWLDDLIRQGLADVPSKAHKLFAEMRPRMVDAQMKGVARLLGELETLAFHQSDWHDKLLAKLSKIHLLSKAYQGLEPLPQNFQADVKRYIGWDDDKSALLATQGQADLWQIVGQHHEAEEGLTMRRTWLKGENSASLAMILDFAYRQEPFSHPLPAGSSFQGELVFAPSAYPLRAFVKSQQFKADGFTEQSLMIQQTFEVALNAYAEALAACPWLSPFGFALSNVTPYYEQGKFYLKDSEAKLMALRPNFTQDWQLISLAGGRAISLMGEWDGESLLPLAIWANGYYSLAGTR